MSSRYEAPNDDAFRKQLLGAILSDIMKQNIQQRYYQSKKALGIIKLSQSDTYAGTNDKLVFITEDFTNTISFLKANDLFKYLINNNEVDNICVIRRILNYKSEGENSLHEFSQYFRASRLTSRIDEAGKSIEDKIQINEIMDKCRTNYFTKDGGYIVRVKIKDADIYTYLFLPEGDAPSYLKDL